MGKMPDRDFAERLNGLTRRNLILLAKNMTNISSEANPNNDHLTWFANTVELFQFEGHEGFRLQGYHIPSIFTKPIGKKRNFSSMMVGSESDACVIISLLSYGSSNVLLNCS